MDAGFGEFFFEIAGGGHAEVKDAGGEGGVGFALAKYISEVSDGACASGGDDGDADGGADGGGEFAVKS